MTTKYLLASTSIIATCVSAAVAFPLFAILPAATILAAILHLLSSWLNGLLTPARVLIGYLSIVLVSFPFANAYIFSSSRPPLGFEIRNGITFILGFGICIAVAFRILDATIGRFRHKRIAPDNI